ncbi:hypothetical protein E6O75_ATG11751 [Venturia nashicola]|uniref:Uncharacterized protein n=1 Tax=Venturia nashicola TaxID=86259 RepID=A0A4Z1P4I7_9PEZI|nr:hypothetical protein E6O75_ATG11751 [Venturia nashicola]
MDNLRSLNTSLPSTSSPRRQPSQPPELLLQLFKDAALNVTTLYKTAAAEHQSRYNEGYQDALEELLNFLDNKNLGLQDGEGWSVRQWATERFNGTTAAATTSTSESEEEAEAENRARSSSPVLQRKSSRDQLQTPTHHAQVSATSTLPSNSRLGSAPLVAPAVIDQVPREQSHTLMIPPQTDFTFQSSHQYPSVHDIEMDNSSSEGNNSPAGSTLHVNIHRPRHNSRHSNRNNKSSINSSNNNRSSSNTSLGPGAGVKRRQPTADFFDLGGFNGKDHTGGGGKRSRFT